MTVPSPNQFLLEDLLLELGQKCLCLPWCGTVRRGRISDAETERAGGDRVGQWHKKGVLHQS